ncbi:MFS general substrate transporter [Amanita muscaria]
MADSKTDDRFNRADTIKELEKNIVWKLDTRVMPLILIINLACFLDRVNIANAAIAGLTTDLNLHGVQLNTALSVFFIPYILVELPSNLVMKKFRSGRWLGFLAIGWGLVTTFTGLTQTYTGLIVVRLMLGLFEGGLNPGILFYMSCLYKRHELQLRIAMLLSTGSFSGLLSGLLASSIIKLGGVRNLSGWRWIFILEGIATVIIGIFIAVVLPNDVGTAWFLSNEERARASKSVVEAVRSTKMMEQSYCLALRLKQEQSGTSETKDTSADSEEGEVFEWKEVKRGILDIQTWLTSLAIFGVGMNLFSFVFSLPTIIAGFGYTGSQAQLYTVPPYALAAFFIIIVSALSDRLKLRGPVVLVATPLTIIGYTMAIVGKNNTARYIGCCLLAIGPYISSTCILTVLANNSSGYYKRATAMAVQITFLGLSGTIAPFLYTSDQKPRYIRGHLISLGFSIFTWIFMAANVLYCIRENKARSEGRRAGNVEKYKALREAGLTKAPIGDRHPNFKFTL